MRVCPRTPPSPRCLQRYPIWYYTRKRMPRKRLTKFANPRQPVPSIIGAIENSLLITVPSLEFTTCCAALSAARELHDFDTTFAVGAPQNSRIRNASHHYRPIVNGGTVLRQRSNLQPERYLRLVGPDPKKLQCFPSRSCTFVRVRSRNFCDQPVIRSR